MDSCVLVRMNHWNRHEQGKRIGARSGSSWSIRGLCLLALFGEGPANAAESELSSEQKRALALREMSTDRPDATESPFTIDAGHFQIESDLVSRGRDEADGMHTTETHLGAVNLRIGLTKRTELGLFVSPDILFVEKSADGATFRRRGFGDLVVRGKFNFWGNDGEAFAIGGILDVTLRTAKKGLSDRGPDGGFLIPIEGNLGGGWSGGAMVGAELHRSKDHSGYTNVLIATATVSHALIASMNIYFELASESGGESDVGTFNTGLTLRVSADLQLDAGVNLGLSRAATDQEVFLGVARRF